MKTITEFAAATLKNATQAQQELQAANKTAEEMPQAMGEALKLEGEKLGFLLNALEAVGNKLNDLKRVIVFSLSEGEKAPAKALQKGEHYFVAEYYPPLASKDQDGKKGRHFEGKGKERKGKRGDRKEGRHGKPRRDRAQGEGQNRGPRPARPAAQASGKPPVIIPKGAPSGANPQVAEASASVTEKPAT